MAPGETRSRPIRERQSVCPIRRVCAEVRKGAQERKTGLPAGHWKTVLDGEVLRAGLGSDTFVELDVIATEDIITLTLKVNVLERTFFLFVPRDDHRG